MSTTRRPNSPTAWFLSVFLVVVVQAASAVESADGGGAIASDNWDMSITFQGLVGGAPRILTAVHLGVHPAGTDSFDQGIDLLVPPPSPGEALPTAYLFDPNGSSFRQRLTRDMRALPTETLTSLAWLLVFSNNSDADWTIGWDVVGLPSNWAPMRLVSEDVGVDIDMRTESSLVVPAGGGTTFTIEATLQSESGVQVAYELPEQLAKVDGDTRVIEISSGQPLFVNTADPDAPVEIEAISSDPDIVEVELQDGLVVLTFKSPGTATITLRPLQVDGGAVPSVVFPVTVLDSDVVNDPPTVAPIRGVIMDQGTPMTVPIQAEDPEGDLILLSGLGIERIGTAQDGETIPFVTADSIAAEIHIEADNVAKRGARFRVTVGVSDGLHDPTRLEFLLLVRSTNARPAVSAPPSVQAAVGDEISIEVSAQDPDEGDTLTLTGALPVASSDASPELATALRTFNRSDAVAAAGAFTKTLTYTTTPEMEGTYVDIWWTADDGFASSSGTTTVVVGDVNLPPEVDPISRQEVNEGGSLEIPIVITDPEGGPVTVTVEGMSTGASYDPNTSVFRWLAIPFGAAGRHIIVARVTDDADNTTVVPIDITVLDVNQPPMLAMGDAGEGDGVPAEITIVRGLESVYVVRAYDADGDDVQLGVGGLPSWARGRRIGDRKNPAAVLSLEAPDEAEPFSVILTATDSGGLSVEETVSIVIEEPANLPPRVEAPLAASVRAGDLLSAFVPSVDPDGDATTLSITPEPSGLTSAPTSGGFQITWRPTPSQAREAPYVLALTVTDEAGEEGTASFLISVSPAANRPPTGGDAVPVIVEEGARVVLDLLDGVFDPDGDVLTVELTTDLPPTAFSLQAGDDLAVLTVTPEVGDAGAYTAEVLIKDGRGGRLVQGWSITVPDEDSGRL
ncbi:MAG: Ig-like domain-containing protein, partial [Candidatus Poribacteria bacterium]